MLDFAFVAVASKHVLPETKLWLRSVRLFNGDVPVFLGCDLETANAIGDDAECLHQISYQDFDINKVGNKKADIIAFGLTQARAVLYTDVDVLFVGGFPVETINTGLVLSPHFISDREESLRGHFNSGYIGVTDPFFPQWWSSMLYSRPNLYGDQQCLDTSDRAFLRSTFTEQHNLGWWRELHDAMALPFAPRFEINNGILYRGLPLVSVHSHLIKMPGYTPLNNSLCVAFNRIFLSVLQQSSDFRHRELMAFIESSGPNV